MPELTDAELDGLVAYWEAANYLTVAQIYLRDNAPLRESLRAERIKPRLPGHWGTPTLRKPDAVRPVHRA